MFLANVVASGEKVGIGEAAITALLGYVVVFVGLLLLMIVVVILGKIMVSINKKNAAEAPAAPIPAVAAAPAVPAALPAPGTAGEIKLYDTPDKEAAMIMAIVAHQMGKPLNELRFKSIKEVK